MCWPQSIHSTFYNKCYLITLYLIQRENFQNFLLAKHLKIDNFSDYRFDINLEGSELSTGTVTHAGGVRGGEEQNKM